MLFAYSSNAFTYQCQQQSCGGLCYKFTSPFASGTNQWNFGDNTPIYSTTETTTTHCFTNVNTYDNVNNTVTVALKNGNNTTQYSTLTHSNCQHGIFIGAVDGVTVTDLSQYTALPGNSFNGQNNTKDIYVYARVRINKDFQFTSANLFMLPSAGFDVIKNLLLEQSTKITTKPGCNCLWRGIEVLGGALTTSTNTTLSNALYAVAFKDKQKISIQQTSFVNNYIGVLGKGNNSVVGVVLTANTFTSSGSLLSWCGGESLLNDPFLPSNGLYSNDRTWAGIYFNGLLINSIGQNAGNPNTFSNIANGMVLINSSIGKSFLGNLTEGITGCRFLNIFRGGYPTTTGGFGIYFKDIQGGHFMRQVGSGMNNGSNPSFNGCEVGIYGEYPNFGTSTKIVSTMNTMLAMETGYDLYSPLKSIIARITSNTISSDHYYGHGLASLCCPSLSIGISAYLGSQNATTNMVLNNNVITIDHDFGVSAASGIRVFKNYLDQSTAGNIEIKDNHITILREGTGIIENRLGNAVIQDNVVHTENPSSVAGSGIYLFAGVNVNVLCNDITGPVSTEPSLLAVHDGIYSILGTDPQIKDNHITNFGHGVRFDYDNGDVELRCNDFLGFNTTGLNVDFLALVGANQADKGNVWKCTSASTFEANSNSYSFSLEVFKALIGTSAFPDNWWPPQFFENSGNQIPPCPSNPNCGLTVVTSELTPTDFAIAQGQITGFPGMVNSREQFLYRKLKASPSLTAGSQVMQDFVNSRDNTPVGKFDALQQAIPNLGNVPDAIQGQLDANLELVQAKMDGVMSIAGQLDADPPEPQYSNLLQQYEQLAADIVQLYATNDALAATLQANQVALANALLAQNSAINAVAVYEQNDKQVYDIFLRTIGMGNTNATPAQLATLAEIAAQCPEQGGRAILNAINLHQALTGSNLPILHCATEQRETKNNKSLLGLTDQLSVSPNPTSGPCSISYQLAEGQTGAISVFDGYGKRITVFSLDAETGVIPLDDLPSGIYFIQLSAKGKLVKTEKLIRF
jgi:hypothetical protein